MKTKFDSYCVGNIAEGCKYCIRGEKLVLFIGGLCSRNCSYCSLSEKRKNINFVWANERLCRGVKDAFEEARESNAKGAGITGGDPLLIFGRTLKYAKALKKKFKNFHIHIYLPTNLVTKRKLKKLSKYVDEVRFHPGFLIYGSYEDIDKIKLAGLFFKKENIGCELPLLPDKKEEILNFINKIKSFVGFVNLNEFEIGDSNLEFINKHYKLNKDGYTIKDSKEAGLWILKRCKGLNIHLCTARTKNFFQYKNRLKLHSILPYGNKTGEGTIIYYAIYSDKLKKLKKELKNFKEIYIDKKKKRIILSKNIVPELLGKYKIAKVEEYPTFEGTEVEKEYV